MLLDIAAIQEKYGVNTDYFSGDTTIELDGSSKLWTVWDGGGDDTLYASAYNGSVEIDLRAGFDSSGTQYVTKVGNSYTFMAYHSDIENAIGTDSNDTIHGKDPTDAVPDMYAAFDGKNYLQGGEGDDELYGHGGDDTLEGTFSINTLVIAHVSSRFISEQFVY